ncbi:MAG: 16S rRNA (guanine(527)-N(7))-methyltransferase RsmG [Rhodobacteraceae bacterium]|nr:16S rRNA (guanine(527)-N(7))-methyltransferase RsmG [Paracoccaceae bacterium]
MADDAQFRQLSRIVDVSYETFTKISIYHKLLEKWNMSINLVGRSTIENGWERHFLDSAQLWPESTEFKYWVDIGSGAGFPGLLISIIASELRPDAKFHLVESDARKCAFLRNVSRETSVPVKVHNCRIEDFSGSQADFLSARALAPLDKLLTYAEKILAPAGECLFLKGKDCDKELEKAYKNWDFKLDRRPSIVQGDSSVLKIGDISRAKPS